MTLQPIIRSGPRPSVDVVGDDNDRAPTIVAQDLVEKLDHVGDRAVRGHPREDVSSLDVECAEEVSSALAFVLELDADGLAPSHATLRVSASQRLNAWLLVETEDGRLFGRRYVQPADSGRFVVEVGIVGIEPILHAVWFERHGAEKRADRLPADLPSVSLLDVVSKTAHRPAGDGNPELLGRLNDERCEFLPDLRLDLRRAPLALAILHAIEALGQIALQPASND